MKKCSNCAVEKEDAEFHKRNLSKDGLAYVCKPCVEIYKTAHRAANLTEIRQREKTYRIANINIIRQRKKKYYATNPEAHRERSKKYQQKVGPEPKRLARIKRDYGVTESELTCLKNSQKGCCALCGDRFSSSKNTHIDHLHGSDPVVVRGILCNSCNVGLGYFKDSPERLIKAAEYLKKFLDKRPSSSH